MSDTRTTITPTPALDEKVSYCQRHYQAGSIPDPSHIKVIDDIP